MVHHPIKTISINICLRCLNGRVKSPVELKCSFLTSKRILYMYRVLNEIDTYVTLDTSNSKGSICRGTCRDSDIDGIALARNNSLTTDRYKT